MRKPSRRLRVAAATFLLIGLPLVGTAAAAEPAAASTEVAELSPDGLSYSRTMSDLFGPRTLIPTEIVGDSFWVRNGGEASAHLSISLVNVIIPNSDLAEAITVSAGPVGSVHPGLPMSEATPCLTLFAGGELQPGESIEIESALALGDLDGTRGQDTSIGFDLRVMLSDVRQAPSSENACGATPPPGSGPAGPPGDGVPSESIEGATIGSGLKPSALALTGETMQGVAVLAAVLLCWGLLIVARRRRGDDTSEQESEV